jgi:hypothetical protein
MRRLLLFTICGFTMSRTLAAQLTAVPLSLHAFPAAGDGSTASSRALRPERISDTCPSGEITGEWIYPIVGRAAGLYSTFFYSDLSIANFRNTPQDYLLAFYPQGVSGVGRPAERLTIGAHTVSSIIDVTGPSGLNVTGLGMILATAVLPSSVTVDVNAQLAGELRIYTNSSSAGKYGFDYQAFSPRVLPATTVATVFGVLQNADFRTNGTLTNLETVPHDFVVTAIGSDVSPIQWTETVPGLSMLQFPVPSTFSPSGYFVLSAQPLSLSGSLGWTFSAATIDNHTGDAYQVSARYLF